MIYIICSITIIVVMYSMHVFQVPCVGYSAFFLLVQLHVSLYFFPNILVNKLKKSEVLPGMLTRT
jgi:hypothetical protein